MDKCGNMGEKKNWEKWRIVGKNRELWEMRNSVKEQRIVGKQNYGRHVELWE